MIFVWEDGFTKEFEAGKRIHGLKRNGTRPISVTISDEEKLVFGEDVVGQERWKKYYAADVHPALRPAP